MVAIVCAGLVAPAAAADFVPQMETNLSVDPQVVLAPSADRPKPIVTWEGTVWFSGYESVPRAYGTTATLNLPSGVTVESVSSRQCHVRGSVVTCSFGTLPSDEQRTVRVRARVDHAKVGDRLGATLFARARNVSVSAGRDPLGPLVVDNTADLEVDFFQWRDSVAPGAEMSYGIEATNNGPLTTAPAAVIIKPGPQLTEPQIRMQDSTTCTRSAEGFRCPFVRSIRLDLSGIVSADAAGTILSTSLTAEFAGDDPPVDPRPDNNTQTKITNVEHRADLATTLSVTPDSVAAADLVDKPALTYRATVTNRGPGIARQTELLVRESFGEGIEFGSPPAGCTDDFGVKCAVGDLAVGASREYIIQAKATQKIGGEQAEAQAQVTAANDDFERPDDNRAVAILNVPGNLADLGVDISGQPNPLPAGQPVTIVTNAANHGPLPAANASVQIQLDTQLSDAQIQADGGTCRIVTNGWFECTLNELSGEPATIKITGNTELNPGDRLTGRATINAVGNLPEDHNSTNDLAWLDTPVVTPPATANRTTANRT